MTKALVAILISGGVACAAAPSAGAAITQEQVCAVTNSYFNTPSLQGPQAWDWPEELQRTIAAHRWEIIQESRFRDCPSATIPVVGLTFSEDSSLAQITRSSYPLEGGSIDTCLLQRAAPGSPEPWQVVGCKLDAVS